MRQLKFEFQNLWCHKLGNKQLHILPNISRNKFSQVIKFAHICWIWGWETSSRHVFWFLKKLYTKQKQLVSTLVSVYLVVLNLDIQLKLYKTSECWSRNIRNFDFLKSFRTSFSTQIYAWIFKKIVPHVILYKLIKFYFLIVLTSWYVYQSVYFTTWQKVVIWKFLKSVIGPASGRS